jgi:hypothetical protein
MGAFKLVDREIFMLVPSRFDSIRTYTATESEGSLNNRLSQDEVNQTGYQTNDSDF